MPSPFPGMDPYLEQTAVFPGLHDRLIAYLSESLQSRLPEPYYAEISDRVWFEVSSRAIGPDVNVLKRDDDGSVRPENGERSRGTALRSRPVVVTVPHDEYREPVLQIFAQMEGERLVTTIEVLSLSNKTSGSQGRELYLRKQREILSSQTHLVEIDLLRSGEHTTAVPQDLALKKAGSFDYHVCVHHYDKFEDFLVYPVRLDQRLPEIALPLRPEDAPLSVDLQDVFDRAYDAGPYRRRIGYRRSSPTPPLRPADEEWASRLLEAKLPE